jgi:succinyl-CoA synthetase beta subunit
MKCDVIATGIVNAARKLDMKVPLVVRLEGTNVEQGKKILADSGLALEPADSLSQAAEKIVQMAAEAN